MSSSEITQSVGDGVIVSFFVANFPPCEETPKGEIWLIPTGEKGRNITEGVFPLTIISIFFCAFFSFTPPFSCFFFPSKYYKSAT